MEKSTPSRRGSPTSGSSSPAANCEPLLQSLRDEIAKLSAQQRQACKSLVEAQNDALEKRLIALTHRVDQVQQYLQGQDSPDASAESTKLRPRPYELEEIGSMTPSRTVQFSTESQVLEPPESMPPSPAGIQSQSSGRSWRTNKSLPTGSASWVRKVDISERSRFGAFAEKLKVHSGRRSVFCPGLHKIAGCLEWLASLREPERGGCLRSFVRSKPVEIVTAVVITLNALFVGYTTNYEITHLDERPTYFILGMELFFVGFYTVELLLKLLVHRCYFLINEDRQWNTFDLVVLLCSYFDLFTTMVVWGSGSYGNLTFMRMLRIFKIVKVIRTFRAMRFFRELRLMMDCVLGSFIQLFWCLVMIVFVVYMFALIFVQGVVDYLLELKLEGTTMDRMLQERFDVSFGSVQSGVVTLFQAITGGVDWGFEYDLVVMTGWVRGALFLFYIVFFVIAVWNIIMSIFVEQVLNLAKPDLDTLMMEKRRRDANDAKELKEMFERLDFDSSDNITMQEFERCCEDEAFASFLLSRGVDIKEARTFFTMLSESNELENGAVDLGTIVGSCLRIKGFATSIDLHILRYEVRMSHRRQQRMMEKVQVALGTLMRMEAAMTGRSPPSTRSNSKMFNSFSSRTLASSRTGL